jgi:3,4-dihydroxy-2-butanone 4-phosphate synthase
MVALNSRYTKTLEHVWRSAVAFNSRCTITVEHIWQGVLCCAVEGDRAESLQLPQMVLDSKPLTLKPKP